jgi:hypothetical protein
LSTIPAHRASRSLPVILYPTYRPPAENKLVESGIFSSLEKHQLTHHDLPPIHHKLTSKKPRSAHHFYQNTLQKHPSTIPRKNYSRGSSILSNTCAM